MFAGPSIRMPFMRTRHIYGYNPYYYMIDSRKSGPGYKIQDFLKGVGGEDIHKHPPPWTLSAWRHPPSGKFKNTPTLGHSQAPPPWTVPVWHHPHSKGGVCVWSVPVTHTLHRFSVSGQVQGGGGWSSLSPAPLDSPLLYTGYGWAVYIMAETRSLAPIAVDG